jgi:hypothetical protein
MGEDPFKLPLEETGPGAAPQAGAPEAPFDDASGDGRRHASLRDLVSGNWLLVGLFAAGIASLYGLSLMKGPSAASAQQIEAQSSVDDALAKLNVTASGGKTTAAIVETFYCEAKYRQIPPAALKGNPFLFRAAPPAPAAAPPPAAEAAPAAKPPDTTGTSEALTAVKALRLQSVMMSSPQTAAIISDNLLTEGQVIRGWTVTQILPREVHLSWKDQTYVLKMSE